MLIDCDTCTARGAGCADCVVTVLLGAPPGGHGTDPVVVPLTTRTGTGRSRSRGDASGETAEDAVVAGPGVVVEFDDVERRAVGVLADLGLVPPLRHQSAGGQARARADRRTG